MRWAVFLRSVVLLIAVASEQGQLHLCRARRASAFQTFGDNWKALIHILVVSAMSCVSHRSTWSRPYDGCAIAASTVKLFSHMRNPLNLKGFQFVTPHVRIKKSGFEWFSQYCVWWLDNLHAIDHTHEDSAPLPI